MRTTITLDDALLDQLKRRAAESGTTVSRLIEDSVRLSERKLSTTAGAKSSFRLITFGGEGQFTPFNVDKTSALLELEDLERYREADS